MLPISDAAQRLRMSKRNESAQRRCQDHLETEIDRLLFKVIEEGGMTDVEDALRLARRRLILGYAK